MTDPAVGMRDLQRMSMGLGYRRSHEIVEIAHWAYNEINRLNALVNRLKRGPEALSLNDASHEALDPTPLSGRQVFEHSAGVFRSPGKTHFRVGDRVMTVFGAGVLRGARVEGEKVSLRVVTDAGVEHLVDFKEVTLQPGAPS